MRHGKNGAFEGLKTLLQRLRARQIQVVRRLIEEQQGRAGEFQKKDLESGLLATGERLEGLVAGVRKFVAVKLAGGLLSSHPVPVIITAVQNLQKRSSHEFWVVVGLGEPSGANASSEPNHPRMLHRTDLHITNRSMFHIRIRATSSQKS